MCLFGGWNRPEVTSIPLILTARDESRSILIPTFTNPP